MRVLLPTLVRAGVFVLLAVPVWVFAGRARGVAMSLALACVLIWAALRYAERIHRRHAQRFRDGHCPCCGYDLRAGGDLCPECGAIVWTPDRPLDRPRVLWPGRPRSTLADDSDILRWMLDRRVATGAEAWGDDKRARAIASLVTHVCWPDAGTEPYGRFLPGDPFAVVSSETSDLEFTDAIRDALDVSLTTGELTAFDKLTLGEVVSHLANRAENRR